MFTISTWINSWKPVMGLNTNALKPLSFKLVSRQYFGSPTMGSQTIGLNLMGTLTDVVLLAIQPQDY